MKTGVVQTTAAAQGDAGPLRDEPVGHLPVPAGQTVAHCRRQFLDRRPQLRLAEDGEHPRTARKSRHLAHPGQRQRPIGRWCEGPVQRPAPHPKPSILGPAARWRAIVPAPGTWTPESAAGGSHWYPFRHRLRNRSISLTPITNPLLSPGHANPVPPLNLPHASAYFTLALV